MPPVERIPDDELDQMEHMANHLCGTHGNNPDFHPRLNEPGNRGNDAPQRPPHLNHGKNDKEKMRPVWEWNEVFLGMFCYLKYLGFWHAVLITEKHPQQNAVKAVHFAWPGLLSRRVISEDQFIVNLENDELWEVHVPRNRRVPGEVAVQRAQRMIGQRGFNMLWRRSSHVVRECIEA